MVKQRNAEMPNEVFEMKLVSDDSGLHFEFNGMSDEKSHLREPSAGVGERNAEIKRLYSDEGKTQEEIGAMFGINKSTVSRIIGS